MEVKGPRVLMVDDDQELCHLVISYLREDGFDATAVHSGAHALQVVQNHHYDVVVLDLMMPEMSGQEVLRRIVGRSGGAPAVPVLMLTAKGDEVDRVVGLETGADDYLAKPCSLRELSARLRAILRRTSPATSPHPLPLTIGDLTLDAATRKVTLSGRSINLTSAEFSIMQLLMESAGWPVRKEHLMEQALGRKLTPYDRSIDVHIGNLRKKLSAGSNYDAVIKTIRGRGYLFIAARSKDLA
jgi:DNA-binding response OmpR family regulator